MVNNFCLVTMVEQMAEPEYKLKLLPLILFIVDSSASTTV